jgi:S1-C subfamily serine protease
MLRYLFAFFMLASIGVAAEQPSFLVRVEIRYGNHTDWGSGTLIRDDLVLTAFHNVRDIGTKVPTIVFKDGSTTQAKVLNFDPLNDLALLKLDYASLLEPVVLALNPVKVRDKVTILGFRSENDVKTFHVVSTRVKKLQRMEEDGALSAFYTSQRAFPGMSGGTITNNNNEQCGVLWGSDRKNAFGTHIKTLREFLEGTEFDKESS